jgi:hypothetical protein
MTIASSRSPPRRDETAQDSAAHKRGHIPAGAPVLDRDSLLDTPSQHLGQQKLATATLFFKVCCVRTMPFTSRMVQ